MKFKFFLLVLVFCFCFGCAASTARPIKPEEFFPQRNTDPRLGLFINEGEAHLNIFIYDEAGRLVNAIYFAGVNRVLTVNGREWPRICGFRLEPGWYRLEILPFYYQANAANLVLNLVGKLGGRSFGPDRCRVDLEKQEFYLLVDRDPTDIYYEGRHFGWVCRLNGGRIPETNYSFPGIKINVWGDF